MHEAGVNWSKEARHKLGLQDEPHTRCAPTALGEGGLRLSMPPTRDRRALPWRACQPGMTQPPELWPDLSCSCHLGEPCWQLISKLVSQKDDDMPRHFNEFTLLCFQQSPATHPRSFPAGIYLRADRKLVLQDGRNCLQHAVGPCWLHVLDKVPQHVYIPV